MVNAEEVKKRMKSFAVRVLRFVKKLPQTMEMHIIAKQVIRSSTSVGANYRASDRAKSQADFIAKMGIVEEETDETLYWLEILEELGVSDLKELLSLKKEANELLAITVASIKTAKRNRV